MTPDEMTAHIVKQHAGLNAIRMAMDALMVALPKEEQHLWLKILRSLAANEAAVLKQHGASPTAIQHQVQAVERQLERLEIAQTSVTRADFQ